MRHKRFKTSVIVFSFILAMCGVAILLAGGEELGKRTAVLGIAALYVSVLGSTISKHPKDLLEADVLFLLVFGMYGVLPLVLAQVPLHLLTDIALWYVTQIAADLVVVQCIGIALVGFSIGLWLPFSQRLAAHAPTLDGQWRRGEGRLIAYAFIAVGGVLALSLVYRVGLATFTSGSYLDTFEAVSGLGYLVAGIQFVALGILVLMVVSCERGGSMPWVALGLLALFALVNLRVGGRRDAIEPILAALVVIHFLRRPLSKKFLVSMGVSAVLLFALVGQARAFMNRGLAGMLEHVQTQFTMDDVWRVMSELQVVTESTSETAQIIPMKQPYRYGTTYLEAFEILIPLAIKPERPLAPGQWFVWTRDAAKAARGGGYSYSLIAEGYLNFGYFGVGLVSFLQGMFIAALVAWRRANPTSRSRTLLYAVCVMALISMVRGDFATLLKSYGVIYGLPALAAAWWLARSGERVLVRRGAPLRQSRAARQGQLA